LPGAAHAVDALRRGGIGVRFVTNTTSLPSAQIAAALDQAGIEVGGGELLTAGSATADLLRREHPGATCQVLDDGAGDDLAGVKLADPDATDADVVVIGSGGPSFTWERLDVALRCLLGGAHLVAMHGSTTWRTDEGFCLDGGAYVTMLEAAAGVTATVVGKPATPLFLAAVGSLGLVPSQVAMVGDDLVSDVTAAQRLGLVGVLVRTGKFRPEQLERAVELPDHVVDSVADVPALLSP